MGRNCTFRIGAVDVMNSTSDGGTGAHCPHSPSVTGMDSRRRPVRRSLVLATSVLLVTSASALPGAAQAVAPSYDITTLAGKVAALRGTAGLQVRFSGFVEQEAAEPAASPAAPPITPAFVLSSLLDGTMVIPPDVTVNQDTAAAPQNETTIAVDPNNPRRIVAGANDYVSRTWSCTVNGTPCSALGDGYSGTYFSNDGGQTWCCTSTDPAHLGTLIPGVERLTGGPYDAGGDPAVAFDSRGTVYYAGLGFNRSSAPNTVTVSRGTFDSGGLSWGAPTFINATTSASTSHGRGSCSTRATARTCSRRSRSRRRPTAAAPSQPPSSSPARCFTARARVRWWRPTARCTCSGRVRPASPPSTRRTS